MQINDITAKVVEEVKDLHGDYYGEKLYALYLKSKIYPYNMMSSLEWFTNASAIQFNKLVNYGYEVVIE